MADDIKDWIIEWFVKNTDLNREEIKQNISENFLKRSWIDSLKFVIFISDLEENYNVQFSADEFQDKKFSTIKGLAEVIRNKKIKRSRNHH